MFGGGSSDHVQSGFVCKKTNSLLRPDSSSHSWHPELMCQPCESSYNSCFPADHHYFCMTVMLGGICPERSQNARPIALWLGLALLAAYAFLEAESLARSTESQRKGIMPEGKLLEMGLHFSNMVSSTLSRGRNGLRPCVCYSLLWQDHQIHSLYQSRFNESQTNSLF